MFALRPLPPLAAHVPLHLQLLHQAVDAVQLAHDLLDAGVFSYDFSFVAQDLAH